MKQNFVLWYNLIGSKVGFSKQKGGSQSKGSQDGTRNSISTKKSITSNVPINKRQSSSSNITSTRSGLQKQNSISTMEIDIRLTGNEKRDTSLIMLPSMNNPNPTSPTSQGQSISHFNEHDPNTPEIQPLTSIVEINTINETTN
jgi:hypothetical protein